MQQGKSIGNSERKNVLEHKERWYEHEPEGVVENENVKLLWDMTVQCDNIIEARRPDIVLVDKKRKNLHDCRY